MRIFVSEYLCSGAWPDSLDNSLAVEGKSMLLAVLDDISQLEGITVCTTWDERLGPFPLQGKEVYLAHSPEEESSLFDALTAKSAGTLVIAPETGKLLENRQQQVLAAGGTWCGCSAQTLQLASRKKLLANLLQDAGVPTIPTRQFRGDLPEQFPVVVKPDDGAGSQHTSFIPDEASFHRLIPSLPEDRSFVIQPYQAGETWSVAFCRANDNLTLFPPARQFLSADGYFRYLGGCIAFPAKLSHPRLHGIEQLVGRVNDLLLDCAGYVGMDLIFPPATDTPVLVEINPRLTTSYLGYRVLSKTNLAPLLLPSLFSVNRPVWKNARVDYEPNGFCHLSE